MKQLILIPTLFLYATYIYAQSSPPVKAIKNPGAASLLTGVFYAPSGNNIVLQNNGKSDLAIVPKKENGKSFTITNFSFPTAIKEGTKFKITVKNIHAGKTIY